MKQLAALGEFPLEQIVRRFCFSLWMDGWMED
jgi:hypothetical protein